MWTRAMVRVAVSVLLASGCTDARKRLAGAEAAQQAAEKRAEDLRASRATLLKELAELQRRTVEARARARAGRIDLRRTRAAASYLKTGTSDHVDTALALAAERFDAAGGSASKIAAVVADVTRDTWPCVGAPEVEGEAATCHSEPYEDACERVSEFDAPVLGWTCSELVKAADTPTVAFCSTQVPSRDQQGFTTNTAVVRTAFFHGGQVRVSDWPEPFTSTYYPRNEEGLAACQTETQRRACVHECDVRFYRYQDPCAAESYGGCGCGGDGPSEPEDEDPQVAAARAQARLAEEEAAEAAERARVARQEVDYQECRSACDRSAQPSPSPSTEADPEVPPSPDSSSAFVHLVKSPAPGVLVIEKDVIRRAGAAALDVETRTVLLESEAVAQARDGSLGQEDSTLSGLRELDSFQDARAPQVAREWQMKEKVDPGPAVAFVKVKGQPAIAGVREDGTPGAWAFSAARGESAAREVDQQTLCGAVAAAPSGFGAAAKDLASACDRAIKAEEEATRLKDQLASIEAVAALKPWKAAVDGSRLLGPAQRRALATALEERRRDLVEADGGLDASVVLDGGAR